MSRINVVILDDEQHIVNSLKRVFRTAPFGVFATTDSKEAMSAIDKGGVKVVLSDQRMQQISGVDFLRKIKEKKPDIIRILFTGYTDIKIAEEAINKGEVWRFVDKPWEDEDLTKIIKQAIEKFDLEESNRQLTRKLERQNEELVSLNGKLRNMYEVQKSFSSTVSHELRTPLSSIKMAIDIVMSKSTGEVNKAQERFLNKAKNNVDRLHRLINDILDLTKIESGKSKIELTEGDINELIREVSETYTPVAEKKGVNIIQELNQKTPKISFDSDKINQVLNNLISNAVKFTDGGKITVSSIDNRESNNIQVCVEDTGPGIKKGDIPKLFKKFQQLGSPETRKAGGTGLGLAICKEIISRHNGKIWVESEFGKGSKFCFLLPIKERRQRGK